MFRHVCVIIRELFRACGVTCESNAMVDKTLRYTLLCVCYVEAWYAPIYLVTCLLCGGLVCSDLSGYVFVMWRPGMHWSIWLRVCYVEAWYALICLVTCLLCGGLVCTDLSGYVFVMWRPGMHRSIWLRCRVRTRGWVRVTVESIIIIILITAIPHYFNIFYIYINIHMYVSIFCHKIQHIL
jgi:hypothetical protein